MKIAIYKDTFANNRGADIAVRRLAAGLSERGHDVTLFDKSEFGAKVRGDYDVIISTGTNEILDLAKIEGLPPIVQQFHTDPRYPFRHWIKRWRRNRAIKAAIKKASVFQVLSPSHVSPLEKILGGADPGRIAVIGNWSGYEEPSPLTVNEKKVILCPGAINKDKNQSLLVDSFAEIASEFPDWEVHIYGYGKPKAEKSLLKRIASHGLDGRIVLKGYADLKEHYADCSFVAFPSRTEGFPLTVIDAAMFGKPSLMIHDWIGCGEIVEPECFAEGLRKLMADEAYRRELGAQARAYCREHYSREKILDQWEHLLQKIVCPEQERPLVSVVVPAYNVEKTVSATIESLLAQDYSSLEVVCVNDGSTDGTAEILDAFAAKDSRVRLIHKKNGGYGSTVNTGLDAAKGEWLGILESDDTCRSDMLSRLVLLGEENGADMVKADWNLWWHETGDCRPAGKINSKWTGHWLSKKERLKLCGVAPAIWSAIYRKSFLDKNAIRCLETPGAAFQDTSFNIKAILACDKLVVTRNAFVNYRQDNPLSSVRSKTQAESLVYEYGELSMFLERRPDIADWAADTVRDLEGRAYLWNLKRLAPEQRRGFLESAKKRLPDSGIFKNAEKLLKKIESRVARRQRRRHRLVSIHWNSNRIELIVRGKTVFYKSFGRE